MDISFQWSGSLVTVELKAKVEEDIRKEMPGLIERFPNPPNEFMVSLYLRDSLSNLEGSTTAAGKTLVKITYAITHPCLREYFYLGQSFSNEP